MKRLARCIHKEGNICRNHGGSGSAFHEQGYVHPFPNLTELSKSYKGLSKEQLFHPMGQRNVEIPALESEFDDDAAISMLGITFNKGVSKSITDSEMLRKSFFDFDLISEEGLQKLLNLLPVLDYEIVKDVVESMWPAYPTDGLNPATTRMELKGFILDYLNEINTEPADSAGYSDTE